TGTEARWAAQEPSPRENQTMRPSGLTAGSVAPPPGSWVVRRRSTRPVSVETTTMRPSSSATNRAGMPSPAVVSPWGWRDGRCGSGDIVVSTSIKAGTTWMQRILSLLVFGTGPLPDVLIRVSPWIDCRYVDPLDEVVARIEAQTHRRFLKTHLPVDALPFDER